MINYILVSVISITLFYLLKELFFYTVSLFLDEKTIKPKEEKNTKRLSVDVLKELHAQIKIRAAQKGIDMKSWIINAIKREMAFEDSTQQGQ